MFTCFGQELRKQCAEGPNPSAFIFFMPNIRSDTCFVLLMSDFYLESKSILEELCNMVVMKCPCLAGSLAQGRSAGTRHATAVWV